MSKELTREELIQVIKAACWQIEQYFNDDGDMTSPEPAYLIDGARLDLLQAIGEPGKSLMPEEDEWEDSDKEFEEDDDA